MKSQYVYMRRHNLSIQTAAYTLRVAVYKYVEIKNKRTSAFSGNLCRAANRRSAGRLQIHRNPINDGGFDAGLLSRRLYAGRADATWLIA